MLKRLVLTLFAFLVLAAAQNAPAAAFAVWLDGAASAGGNGIPTSLDHAFGAGSATLVTTAQLETAGFLNAFDTVVVSRSGSSFGIGLSVAAAANIMTYVGTGAGQGGVALFPNDLSDNLFGASSGDPFDANLDRLFVNAATFAAASHHGYIGEFNGAVMGVTSNTLGFPALGLLPGAAGSLHGVSTPDGHFHWDVGPIGTGNAIDAGITFPFTDADVSLFRTDITGASPTNIVDIFVDNGGPALLANQVVISGGTTIPIPALDASARVVLTVLLAAAGFFFVKRISS